MNLNKKQGFTLIELLVVVAIIGILASLVIASVNQARSRGVDAAIKGTMSSLRAQAELEYDSQGNFNAVCDSSNFERLVADVADKAGGDADSPYADDAILQCNDGFNAWAASVRLTTGEDEYFCVDSTGFAGEIDGMIGGGTECDLL